MSHTSKKHEDFVAEPMGEKPVTKLAGIGPELGKKLEALGFKTAYAVLGKYLSLGKDKKLFEKWLKDTVNANSKQSSECYQCLTDWCREFL